MSLNRKIQMKISIACVCKVINLPCGEKIRSRRWKCFEINKKEGICCCSHFDKNVMQERHRVTISGSLLQIKMQRKISGSIFRNSWTTLLIVTEVKISRKISRSIFRNSWTILLVVTEVVESKLKLENQ